MNVHHLELFYHVATHRGIAPATQNMPYGVQRSTISEQITALEDSLGTRLFERRPFALTPAGEKLFRFVQPFFGNIETMANEIRADLGEQLRVGAPEMILRDYLPEAVDTLREKLPDAKLTLRDGNQPELEELLLRREIDIALTTFDAPPAENLCAQKLFELPLALVVSQNSKLKTAEDLWKNGCIDETLLRLPESYAITRNFQEGLKALNVDEFPSLELSSVDLIEVYVRNGHGIGVSIDFPRAQKIKGVRLLPLKNFKPITFGILWHESLNQQMTVFIEIVKAQAAEMKKRQK